MTMGIHSNMQTVMDVNFPQARKTNKQKNSNKQMLLSSNSVLLDFALFNMSNGHCVSNG